MGDPKGQILEDYERVLRKYYNGEIPMPTNTRFILNALKAILEKHKTSSLLLIDNYHDRIIALGYVLMLISHCVDREITFLEPRFIYLLNDDKNIILALIKAVVKELNKQ